MLFVFGDVVCHFYSLNCVVRLVLLWCVFLFSVMCVFFRSFRYYTLCFFCVILFVSRVVWFGILLLISMCDFFSFLLLALCCFYNMACFCEVWFVIFLLLMVMCVSLLWRVVCFFPLLSALWETFCDMCFFYVMYDLKTQSSPHCDVFVFCAGCSVFFFHPHLRFVACFLKRVACFLWYSVLFSISSLMQCVFVFYAVWSVFSPLLPGCVCIWRWPQETWPQKASEWSGCLVQLRRRSYRPLGGSGLPHVGHAPSAPLLQEQIWLIDFKHLHILLVHLHLFAQRQEQVCYFKGTVPCHHRWQDLLPMQLI